jgi:hypothetical protein
VEWNRRDLLRSQPKPFTSIALFENQQKISACTTSLTRKEEPSMR